MKLKSFLACFLIISLLLAVCNLSVCSAETDTSDFDSALDKYVLTDTLFASGDSLDNNENISSYTNWRFSKVGIPFRDEHGLQRNSNDSSDAVLELIVTENTALEVATVISENCKSYTTNTYYYSSDGVTWSLLDQSKIKSKTVTKSDDNLLKDNYFAVLDRIICPTNALNIRIVTSTNNISGSWWQPSIEYIDIYRADFSYTLEGYSYTATLFDGGYGLDNKYISDYQNWAFGTMGLAFRDKWGLQRNKDDASDASLILHVTENTALEVATVISENCKSYTTNTYYYSSDGLDWNLIEKSKINSKRVIKSDDNLLASTVYFALLERIICPENTSYIKIVTSTENKSGSWWQPSIEYIDVYHYEYDTALLKKGITASLLDGEEGLDTNYITSNTGWIFGSHGLSGRDDYTTQRARSDNSDAQLIVKTSGAQALETGTVCAVSYFEEDINTFYVSDNGVQWQELDIDKVCSKKYLNGQYPNIKQDYCILIQRLVLSEDIQFVKIVTSTDNISGSWWSVGVDYIDLYKTYLQSGKEHSFTTVEELDFSTASNGLENETVYSSKGFETTASVINSDKSCAKKNTAEDAEIVLKVNDSQSVGVEYVIHTLFDKVSDNRYYASADGKIWRSISADNVVRKSSLSEKFLIYTDLISNLPVGTAFFKIVSTNSGFSTDCSEFAINTIGIYDQVLFFEISNDSDIKAVILENEIIIDAENKALTVDDLSGILDFDCELYYYDTEKNEIFDGRTILKSGFTLNAIINTTIKGEYAITVNNPYILSDKLGFPLTDALEIDIGTLSLSTDLEKLLSFEFDNSLSYYTSADGASWKKMSIDNPLSLNLPSDAKYLKVKGMSVFSLLAQQDIGCIVFSQETGAPTLVTPIDSSFVKQSGNFVIADLNSADVFVDELIIELSSAQSKINIKLYYTCDNTDGSAAYDSLQNRYYLRGDSNSDYNLNILDLISLKKKILDSESVCDIVAADYDFDGKINAADLTMTKKSLLWLGGKK